MDELMQKSISLLVHHEYPIFLPEVLCCVVHARARLSLFLTPDTSTGEPQPYLIMLGRSLNYQKIEKARIRKMN